MNDQLCSTCRQPLYDGRHENSILARLCTIQLKIINLRLEERELRRELKATDVQRELERRAGTKD